MIEDMLLPLVGERFRNDERYREGHLRVINALPQRRVLGLHVPQMKAAAADIVRRGDSADIIRQFERERPENLTYEETVVWGLLINRQRCTSDERAAMLGRYVPVMDNWAVCDLFCADAKWMGKTEREALWEMLTPWFGSAREFEVRFALIASMSYLLHEEWLDRIFGRIDALGFDRIKSEYTSARGRPAHAQSGTVQGAEPYYVRMGAAWLLATALAKFPERTRGYVRRSHLPADVVKLYVRKARESFRTRTIPAI